MPRINYVPKDFNPRHTDIIRKVNQIVATYAGQGFSLTLRQVYYQFVSRGWLENTFRNYKNLGNIITDARRAGHIDWNAITDRTRNIQGSYWGFDDPSQIIEPMAFGVAKWEGQTTRLEVWVEKDALIDVIAQGARRHGVPYFSCRGYTSDSEVWAAAQRLEGYLDDTDVERVVILHLGDHDPSGIDMTRDITDRLSLFMSGDGYGYVETLDAHSDILDSGERAMVKRIALNWDQIQQYGPPPNPAKLTDSRSRDYIDRFGDESWELDALEPSVLVELIRSQIETVIDPGPWADRLAEQARGRGTLKAVKDNYDKVIEFLDERGLLPESETDEDLEDDDDDA